MKFNKSRLIFTNFIFISFILIFIFRIFYIKLGKYQQYNISNNNLFYRGSILDSKNNILASNIKSISLYIKKSELNYSRLHKNIDILSKIIKKNKSYILSKVDISSSKNDFVWLAYNIDYSFYDIINKMNIKGLYFDAPAYKLRVYPYYNLVAQLLGFVNIDNIGTEGLEYSLNKVIGPYYQYKNKDRLSNIGHNIYLTLDIEVQKIIYNNLKKNLKGYPNSIKASVIVMNTKDSSILGIANYPSYDNNNYQKYNLNLYRNYAIFDAYEPGSVMKLLVVSIALEEKLVTLKEKIYCPPVITLNKIPIKRSVKSDYASLSDIIKYSCNVGIIQIAKRIKNSVFLKYISKYGLDKKTNIALSGEGSPIFRKESFNNEMKFYNSFGYGIAVTALQIVNAYSVLLKQGFISTPKIIQKVSGYNKAYFSNKIFNIKKYKTQRVISPYSAYKILDLLRHTLKYGGTAYNSLVGGLFFSAKTGTSYYYNKKEGKYDPSIRNKTFVSLIPRKKNSLIILIVIKNLSKDLKSSLIFTIYRGIIIDMLDKGILVP